MNAPTRNHPPFLCDASGNLVESKIARWANFAAQAASGTCDSDSQPSHVAEKAFTIASAMLLEYDRLIGGGK